MKQSIYALLILATLSLASCQPGGNTNGEAPDPLGTTYPRVQLIEHFTGEACGYCPYGMNLIQELYAANPDKYVWISNHTYYRDEYTISESNTIARKLSVSSAPAISVNRTRYNNSYNYHPLDIQTVMAKQESTSNSTLSIERTYIAAANDLVITVHGKTSEAMDSLRLTLAITESGMIGAQEDYYYTWEGWTKFRHTHAVRTYLTAPLGESVKLTNRTFTKEFRTSLQAGWNDENCMIVGWITAGNATYPVLNAAKIPLVEGSKGGEDIVHGGLEERSVPDTYPESGAPATPVVFKVARLLFENNEDYTLAALEAYDMDTIVDKYSSYNLFPYTVLYFILPANTTELADGTYTIADRADAQPGNIIAGYRNDTEHTVEGSQYVGALINNERIYYGKQWMLTSGALTKTAEGFVLEGVTRNGSPIHAEFTGTFEISVGNSPLRKAEKMHFFH